MESARDLQVSVIVTNFNTWDLAHKCIKACDEIEGGKLHQLVLYDDCSSKENTLEFPSAARIIQGAQNLGLVKALNQAFQQVEGDIIVLFDSDAYPQTPFVEATRKAFTDNPKLGMVAFATVGKSGSATESWCAVPDAGTLVYGQHLSPKIPRLKKPATSEISIFTCAMAIRKAAFDEVGGFDEEFDWIDLDHDLSINVAKAGWELEPLTSVVAFHEGSGTPQSTNARLLRFYKNRWLLLTKHGLLTKKALARGAILARLRLELLSLKLSRRNAEERASKAEGRKQIIAFCRKTYK